MDKVKAYRDQLLEKYKQDNNGELSAFLENPTEVNIKKACLHLFKTCTNKNDKTILHNFFEFTDDNEGLKVIDKFSNSQLRAITNVFKQGKQTTNIPRLNLMALLVDFEPRPFQKFKKAFEEREKEDIKSISGGGIPEDPPPNDPPPPKSRNFQKTLMVVLASLVVLFLGSNLYYNFIKKPVQCMVWVEDHYEESDCKERLGVALNQRLLENFRRIEPDERPTFNEGKPLVWYLKHNGKVEFYNMEGKHPISFKDLKPVTETIIRKHWFKEQD